MTYRADWFSWFFERWDKNSFTTNSTVMLKTSKTVDIKHVRKLVERATVLSIHGAVVVVVVVVVVVALADGDGDAVTDIDAVRGLRETGPG